MPAVTVAAAPPRVLATALLPRRRAVTVALVVGFALLTAAAAQIRINLPFTPVPITGQTFAVLLSGAALGSWAGSASQALYLVLGAVGLPFYAGGNSGWEVVTGATGGYLIGFVVAGWYVGYLAERRQDRTVATALPTFLAGNAVIYLIGVSWLYVVADYATITAAMGDGLVPFIVGDLLKILAAGLLVPATWRLVERSRLG